MNKTIVSKKLISIQDISGGKGEAFVAILHDHNDAKVMGRDMAELFSGIKATCEYIKDKTAAGKEKSCNKGRLISH